MLEQTGPDHPSISNATISRVETGEELREVQRFWYEVYVLEQGKTFGCADPEQKLLADPLDERSHILGMRLEGDIIATSRLTRISALGARERWAEPFSLSLFDAFDDNQLCVASREVVARRYRRSHALRHLMGVQFEHCRGLDIRFVFGYCEPHLVGLWEHMGLRTYKEPVQDPDTGLRVPIVLVLDDVDHLEQVGSPLVPLARRFGGDPRIAAWFRAKFPQEKLP